MAEFAGLPGYPVAVVTHPISNNTDVEIRAKAEQIVQQPVAPLHGPLRWRKRTSSRKAWPRHLAWITWRANRSWPTWSRSSNPSTSCSSSTLALLDGQDVGQVVLDRFLELLVRARLRVAVGSPAVELRGVPKANAFHVFVADLDYPLGPQRRERHVL